MRRCRPCTDTCLLHKDFYHRYSTNPLWCAAPEQQQPEVSVSSIDLNKEVRMKCYVRMPLLDASADANMVHPMHMHTPCMPTRPPVACLSVQVSKFAKNTATTFAPRASGKSNPAYEGGAQQPV